MEMQINKQSKHQSKLTKAQFEILKNYEKQMDMSKGDYVKEIYTKDIKILKPIYESLGFKLDSITCGGCILHMLRVLNSEYVLYRTTNKSKNKQQ